MIMKMRNMMKRKNGQKGFTLIELIVVMAILAVLAAIAVPRYNGILDDAKEKTDAANVKMLQNAVDVYYAQEGAYPATLDALKTDYVKDIPTQEEPTKGADFTYDKDTGVVGQ